jgi:hypothetical protein
MDSELNPKPTSGTEPAFPSRFEVAGQDVEEVAVEVFVFERLAMLEHALRCSLELNRRRAESNEGADAHEDATRKALEAKIRRDVREELRAVREEQQAARRRPARRPPRPQPLPLLRVARPRERRPTRRRVVALRGSPRGPSDPDLADPPDLVGILLALARAAR